ncbi:2OG-Fe(II) oxygenase [Leptolyngbya sp. FACHB-17]|uniref:2OG-Fe(II) oxygenase n=1 Tax=unclassified Leptolyngbya TaxID=2650499 RepID=UPI00167FF1EA|nr:2OG-Fe(II) oxygenase [Leptolyngbya sp. FACHB-17]MBD2083317.1 2OG-Fe(II) oxygenase [Leptolyngbya sp. FACHB-17]
MSCYQPAQFIQLHDFLSLEDRTNLLNYVLAREDQFAATTTSTGAIDYRQSSILYYFKEYENWMVEKVKLIIPSLIEAWNIQAFSISQIEIQLTAHNDGNYYKIHNDNGSEEAANRIISYVYYFHREPKSFFGGALRIYDLNLESSSYIQADSYQDIEPINNSIVFFPSHFLHEVLPVTCRSRRFADSRFTLNGWIRRETSHNVTL